MAFAGVTVVAAEMSVRISDLHEHKYLPTDHAKFSEYLEHTRINGREIGNQMLIHNIGLFSTYPNPSLVTTAYVGTSRTKILRPEWFGISNAVNGSGNTYNEISYGLLLQAEILRLSFPNLRRVYFESSLLLRRPARLILEDDHRKYLPLLESLLPLRDSLLGGDAFRKLVKEGFLKNEQAQQHTGFSSDLTLHLLKKNSEIRFYKLFVEDNGANGISVLKDKWLAELHYNGERKLPPGGVVQTKDQKPPITNEHIKVQRLRDIPSWAPWDGLFDLIALWGREHNIEIVFFQPPVRFDLYEFQVKNGLDAHTRDLERVALQYHVPFIDLNKPELGYMSDWSIFSDEDHMETCPGVVLLQSAIETGYEDFRNAGTVLPVENRGKILKKAVDKLNLCNYERVMSVKN